MIVFKQIMGFLLMATAVWLLWIVGKQLGAEGLIWTLCFLLGLGIGCWMIGSFIQYGSGMQRKTTVWIVAILFAGASYSFFLHPVLNPSPAAPNEIQWLDFSEEKLTELRNENKLVFLDFTAEWCLTCKANEKIVLDSEEVRKTLNEFNVVTMKADYTRRDPVIREKLAGFGRSGVPLYVIYPPNGGDPIVLPEIINKSLVIENLTKAAKG